MNILQKIKRFFNPSYNPLLPTYQQVKAVAEANAQYFKQWYGLNETSYGESPCNVFCKVSMIRNSVLKECKARISIVENKKEWGGVPPNKKYPLHALIELDVAEGIYMLEPQTGAMIKKNRYPNEIIRYE